MEDKQNEPLVVKSARFPQNHPCPSVKFCPVGALLQQGFNSPSVDMDKCIKCGKCVNVCPMRALVLNSGTACIKKSNLQVKT